jgi:hypothetical protein
LRLRDFGALAVDPAGNIFIGGRVHSDPWTPVVVRSE